LPPKAPRSRPVAGVARFSPDFFLPMPRGFLKYQRLDGMPQHFPLQEDSNVRATSTIAPPCRAARLHDALAIPQDRIAKRASMRSEAWRFRQACRDQQPWLDAEAELKREMGGMGSPHAGVGGNRVLAPLIPGDPCRLQGFFVAARWKKTTNTTTDTKMT